MFKVEIELEEDCALRVCLHNLRTALSELLESLALPEVQKIPAISHFKSVSKS